MFAFYKFTASLDYLRGSVTGKEGGRATRDGRGGGVSPFAHHHCPPSTQSPPPPAHAFTWHRRRATHVPDSCYPTDAAHDARECDPSPIVLSLPLTLPLPAPALLPLPSPSRRRLVAPAGAPLTQRWGRLFSERSPNRARANIPPSIDRDGDRLNRQERKLHDKIFSLTFDMYFEHVIDCIHEIRNTIF